MRKRTGNRHGGNSIIEFSFLLPWFVFLFVGIFDFGFFAYSLQSTTAGAIAAANYCAQASGNCTSSSYSQACQYAIDSVAFLPNLTSGQTSCTSPVSMSVTTGTDSYGNNQVSVTFNYTTPTLIPIPGLLPGQITITRAIQLVIGQTV